jgi:tetratricopeptide (TPR) repeat protein
LDKTLRKQIKQDELVSGIESARGWIAAHAEEVRATVIGVVLIAVVGGGFIYYKGFRSGEAQQAFDVAMDIYKAPVGATADTKGGKAFSSRDEKFQQALAAFDGLADRFGSLPEGLQARYYAGLCRMELGQYEEAAKDLGALAAEADGGKGPIEASLARMALAQLDRRQGHLDKAIEVYQKLLDESDSPLPKDAVLSALGQTLEEAGRLGQAAAAFRRLVDEYPSSTYVAQARSRAQALRLASVR